MAGTDKSRSTYRGLLIMDPRITGVVASGDATYSTSYTQQGEAYDTPVPTALTDDMVLQSSGDPEVAGQTFTITTQKSGFPGRDKAGFIWERATDAAPFGWEHPNVVGDWEAIAWTSGASYPTNFGEPDAVTLSDGTIIICSAGEVSSGNVAILTYTRDPVTCTWGSAIEIVDAQTPYAHPCMVVLPDDRVLLFFWVVDTGASVRNIRAYVTSDAGTTWDLHAKFTIESVSDTTYNWGDRTGRLRGVYLNGDIALFGWVEDATPDHFIFQWASSDLGASFQLVDTIEDKTYPDCAVSDGLIVLGCLDLIDADINVEIRRIGTAFQPATDAGVESEIDPLSGDDFGATGADPAGDLALWADEDGTLYVATMVHAGANKEGPLWRSYDAGQTWEQVGASELNAGFGLFWRTEDSTPSYPTRFVGTHYRGSQVLIHQWVAPVGNEDISLAALWLGGYSTLTNPFSVAFKDRRYQVGWDEMWLPYELPSDVNVWTTTSTGVEALDSGSLSIVTVAQTNYYTATPSTSVAQGLIVDWECKVGSGGGVTSVEDVAMRVVWGDGTHGYGINVDMSTTAFRAYDFVSATALGAGATSVDLANNFVQFRLYVAGQNGDDTVGQYALYYRVNDKPGAPKAWTLVVSGDDLTDAGATADQIRWGHIHASSSASRWRHVYWTDGSNTGRIYDHAQPDGQASPGDLNARDYAPVSISVADGLKLRSVDGPTFYNSEWTISSRYEYAIEKILPFVEPSPTEGWRSVDDDSTQYIDFELSSDDSEPLNGVVGVYLQGHNWAVGTFARYTSGAWVTSYSFDLRSYFGTLVYIHNSGALRAGTGTQAGSYYFAFNELAGGVVRFDGGKARRILGNTEGFWQASTSGATKQCTIWFETDGTEAASGSDLTIVPPQALLLVHVTNTLRQAYRLQITTGTNTPEGYYTLNTCVIGPVVIFGKDSDWGRKYGLEPKTTIIENANGNRRSRRMGRPRRSVELPWTDGIDLTQVSGSTAASGADYLLHTASANAIPAALRNDTAWQLEGLLDYTGGGHLPVVYCPQITKGSPDSQYHLMRRDSLYGRIVSDWAAEVVVGDELTDELVRVPGLTIEEEVGS
jgi:hypothetical protein